VADDAKRGTGRRDVVVVVIAVVLVVGTFWLKNQVGNSAAPGEDSVDVGFAQDMQVHHAQAVDMADLIRERSTDEEVRTAARDILLGQQAQIGEMRGWLDVWDRPITTTKPAMRWAHNHSGHKEGEMPGLASAEEMEQLTAASGPEADVLFLELMIRHHKGGVHMAQIAAADAGEPVVREVAQTIVDSQTAEITLLQQLLEPRKP
jgi:uncharacterized protein (DUF305 family)